MVESVPYAVVKTVDRVEIRHYPGLVLATVRGMSDDDAFGILFRFISGLNAGGGKIPMTVPVVSAQKGERIPMTAPVLSGSNYFSFVLPSSFKAETTPRPIDDRVSIEEIPARQVAVLRFRGSGSERQINEKTAELLTTLRNHNLSTVGESFLMRYNPPFIPGIFRKNEVGISVAE